MNLLRLPLRFQFVPVEVSRVYERDNARCAVGSPSTGRNCRAQKTVTPKAQDNVAKGEAEVRPLLLLMDPGKDSRVSKQEFLRFMEVEFDSLDKKNEGKLDVKELTKPPVPPIRGFHK